MGDTPYSHAQANLLDSLIDRVNAEPLAFAAHVGDITSGQGPCDDDWLHERKRQFERFRPPFVLLPGDNEWTDCHRTGFDPLERLAKWRQLFCVPIGLPGFARQAGEHCENARWELGDLVFAGLNVPGSNNNVGRTAEMDAESARRMRAVFAWLDDAVAQMRPGGTLVILMQANPFLRPRGGADGFAALRERLARLGQAHPGKVILVHGDTHQYRDDQPLPGLRRVEVPGAPQVRWLRATVSDQGLRIEPTELP
ncbi:MAG TPA: metallophosphoesterase [Burkholderiales bacterium]|nr:metallophosphoesterase [Burkholderiales bacterium]